MEEDKNVFQQGKEKTLETSKKIMENDNVKKITENSIVQKICSIPNFYLGTIDNGSLFKLPFKLLFGLIAILNAVFPFYIIYTAIDNNLFNAPFRFVMVFLLIWFLIIIASFFSFNIWWNRKNKIENLIQENDSFIATPVFAHFIQTFGEYAGTYIAIVGSLGSLFASIFLSGRDGYQLSRQIGINLTEFGIYGIFIMLISGFIVIIITKFLAEQFRALASIANNTKK